MEDEVIETVESEEEEIIEYKEQCFDFDTDREEKILELSSRVQRYCQKRMIPVFNHRHTLDILLDRLS
jgi:hypothetical protein